jgi:hypothetical protein
MLYAAGSLLFAFALVAAIAVIAGQVLAYRKPMVAALRTLRLDGTRTHTPRGPMRTTSAPVLSYRPVRPARALAA